MGLDYWTTAMNEKSSKERVLVLAAHPDDEVLGCGGTLLKHKARGDSLLIVLMTENSSRHGKDALCLLQAREVARRLGADIVCLELEDQSLDTVGIASLVRKVQKYVDEFRPTVMYGHTADLNRDHRIVREIARIVCRPFRRRCTLLEFRVPGTTGYAGEAFVPDTFVAIEKQLEGKLSLLRVYTDEVETGFNPRSEFGVRSEAGYWGACVGVRAAECFKTVWRSWLDT
jgi:N-acetylglucosamine malate deacetylase 1